MLSISALPAFNDNYILLLQDTENQRCAVVDPGTAEPVEQWLNEHEGWTLEDVLLTHHHDDHTGGVAKLKQLTGCRVLGPADSVPELDLPLRDGDIQHVLNNRFEVISVPGHTLDHIAYFKPNPRSWLFSGDT